MTREQQQRNKIKICGLKRPEDITYVNEAKPDYCGFIIEFPKSSRNVTGALVRELTAKLNPDIIPVGVFVNVDLSVWRNCFLTELSILHSFMDRKMRHIYGESKRVQVIRL